MDGFREKHYIDPKNPSELGRGGIIIPCPTDHENGFLLS